MSKMEQALILDPPSELHFKPPFVEVTTSYLLLTNPTNKDICFKVKTTAPKTYCVRPNSGVIQAKSNKSISVMLQPFDLESADKSRHKFMVQSVYAPENYDPWNLDSVWRDTAPEQFMNSKLKCIFDVPGDSHSAGTQESTNSDIGSEPPKPSSIPKSSPKVSSETNVDHLVQKLKSSNARLQSELIDLHQENSSLKEEGLRSRMAYDTKTRGTSTKAAEPKLQELPPSFQFSNLYIAVSVIVFLLGIYLGKYIL